jgi:small subunit ribosomal protein S10
MAVQSQDIVVKFSSFDSETLDKCVQYMVNSIKKVGAQFSGPIFLPRDIKKVTVIRGPHVDRKAMEQFEVRTHKRVIIIRKASSDVVDSLSKLELPSGIDVKVEVLAGN